MKRDDFKEYHVPAKSFDYQKVPFAKVVNLKFSQVGHEIQYRTSWHESKLTTVNVRKLSSTCQKNRPTTGTFPSVKISSTIHPLSQEKKNDLKSMLKWLPLEDKQYYEKTILK